MLFSVFTHVNPFCEDRWLSNTALWFHYFSSSSGISRLFLHLRSSKEHLCLLSLKVKYCFINVKGMHIGSGLPDKNLYCKHVVSGARFQVKEKLANVLSVVISPSQINCTSISLKSGLAFVLLTWMLFFSLQMKQCLQRRWIYLKPPSSNW